MKQVARWAAVCSSAALSLAIGSGIAHAQEVTTTPSSPASATTASVLHSTGLHSTDLHSITVTTQDLPSSPTLPNTAVNFVIDSTTLAGRDILKKAERTAQNAAQNLSASIAPTSNNGNGGKDTPENIARAAGIGAAIGAPAGAITGSIAGIPGALVGGGIGASIGYLVSKPIVNTIGTLITTGVAVIPNTINTIGVLGNGSLAAVAAPAAILNSAQAINRAIAATAVAVGTP